MGCAAKEPFIKQDVVEASATIEAIDTDANRLLSLRGPSGMATIQAGPKIKNFDQIHVGDQVEVTYTAAVAAKVSRARNRLRQRLDAASYTAPTGSKPAGCRRRHHQDHRRDRICRYLVRDRDLQASRMDYVRTIAPASPEGKKFIKHVEEGRQGGRGVHRGAGDFSGAREVRGKRSAPAAGAGAVVSSLIPCCRCRTRFARSAFPPL